MHLSLFRVVVKKITRKAYVTDSIKFCLTSFICIAEYNNIPQGNQKTTVFFPILFLCFIKFPLKSPLTSAKFWWNFDWFLLCISSQIQILRPIIWKFLFVIETGMLKEYPLFLEIYGLSTQPKNYCVKDNARFKIKLHSIDAKKF